MKSARGFVQIVIVAVIALALGAVGILGYQKYFKKSPASVQKTETTNNSSQTADETANWKMYTNVEEKIQFKYPPDWEIPPVGEEDPSLVSLQGPIIENTPAGPLRYYFNLIVESTNFKTSKEAFTNMTKDFKNDQNLKISSQTITVDGQLGEISTTMPSAEGDISIFVVRGGKLYQFVFSLYSPPVSEYKFNDLKHISNLILSTFKFTADETAGWKTFEDKQLGIYFKYPNSWEQDSTYKFIRSIDNDASKGASIQIKSVSYSSDEILKSIVGTKKTEDITVDNVIAKKITGTTGIEGSVPFVTVVAGWGNLNYIITLETGNDEATSQFHKKEFDQTLSTLKFTN